MEHYWHKRQGNDRLLLIFNGWGFDKHVIRALDRKDYDILLLYNYISLDTMFYKYLSLYRQIDTIAWSFGVPVADRVLSKVKNSINSLIAVNGTLFPVDDDRGIPKRSFTRTLHSMSKDAILLFFNNVFGNSLSIDIRKTILPQRCFQEQLAELFALTDLFSTDDHISCNWNKAIIAQNDRIFPFRNMQRAWGDLACPVSGDHYINFQTLIGFCDDEQN